MSSPTLTPSAKVDAAGLELLVAAHDDVLLELEARDAVDEQPAGAVVAVVDGDLEALPAQHVRRRQPARPGADDADALRPLDRGRGSAATQPSSQAVSVMYFSTEPMVTVPCPDCSMTQLPSQSRSCGQIRPQISGKVLVAWLSS